MISIVSFSYPANRINVDSDSDSDIDADAIVDVNVNVDINADVNVNSDTDTDANVDINVNTNTNVNDNNNVDIDVNVDININININFLFMISGRDQPNIWKFELQGPPDQTTELKYFNALNNLSLIGRDFSNLLGLKYFRKTSEVSFQTATQRIYDSQKMSEI